MSENTSAARPPRQALGAGVTMVAAFRGWNDAGNAASDAVEHLRSALGAVPVTSLSPEAFHDFQVNRPRIERGPDGQRTITWPSTDIWRATTSDGRIVLLVTGTEPSIRWQTFSAEILDFAASRGVDSLITLGALIADVPHTRAVPVTRTSDDAQVKEQLGVESSEYEGPAGIIAVLLDRAASAGLSTLALWAAIPHYVANPPSPKATMALIESLGSTIGIEVDLGSLPHDAQAWQRGVDNLAASDEDIADYVAHLEEAKDTVELPEASGDAIAREFERYLRRRDSGD